MEIVGSVYRSLRRDDAAALVTVSGGIPNTSYHIRSDVFTGTAISTYIDGSVVINNQAQDVGTITLDQAQLGALAAGGSLTLFLNGDIAALLIYNSALSTANQRRVEAYLGARYGITVV
jgi:hypothetical protein